MLSIYRGESQCPGDITPPICSAQDLTVYLDNGGNPSIIALYMDNGSADDCPDPLVLVTNSCSFDVTETVANTAAVYAANTTSTLLSCAAKCLNTDILAEVCPSGSMSFDLFSGITISYPVNHELTLESGHYKQDQIGISLTQLYFCQTPFFSDENHILRKDWTSRSWIKEARLKLLSNGQNTDVLRG